MKFLLSACVLLLCIYSLNAVICRDTLEFDKGHRYEPYRRQTFSVTDESSPEANSKCERLCKSTPGCTGYSYSRPVGYNPTSECHVIRATVELEYQRGWNSVFCTP